MAKKQGVVAPQDTDEVDEVIDEAGEELVGAKDKDPEKSPGRWQPTYQNSVEFDSHLFKCKTSKMLKNVSWSSQKPDIHQIDHQHFFHSHDSSGKEQIHSTATGGHFHLISITRDPVTGEPKAKCSGPKMHKHIKGKKFVVDLPSYNEVDGQGSPIVDTHVHEVNYERSSRVKPRTVNAESIKIISQDVEKAKPIDGIRG